MVKKISVKIYEEIKYPLSLSLENPDVTSEDIEWIETKGTNVPYLISYT